MDSLFDVTIATRDAILYDGKASSLVVPAELGYLGILAHHAPLIAHCVAGAITVRRPDADPIKLASKGDGFLDVNRNRVTVILDSVI